MLHKSNSTSETMKIAEALAQKCSPGAIICLVGDLGVGKTVFAKGFARGLGVCESITSPTFSIVNIYENTGGKTLYHFDVYRISNPSEMEDTGFEEYFYGEGVCLVEWADLINELIPSSAVWVSIGKDLTVGEDYREIKINNANI